MEFFLLYRHCWLWFVFEEQQLVVLNKISCLEADGWRWMIIVQLNDLHMIIGVVFNKQLKLIIV